MRITSYHSHTSRCQHALGSDESYIVNAIAAGYEIFGVSDHCPWPLNAGERGSYRMAMSELADYLTSIKNLKEKYRDRITIMVGLEAEYLEDRMDWLKQLKTEHLQYLVFGNHNHKILNYRAYYGAPTWQQKQIIANYLDDSYRGLASGAYELFAHPDLFAETVGYTNAAVIDAFEKLCQWSKEFNVPLEYNLSGYYFGRGYPNSKLFERAAKWQCPVMVNGDFHDSTRVKDRALYVNRREYLEKLGCLVVETISLD